jgi:hypothetical protein
MLCALDDHNQSKREGRRSVGVVERRGEVVWKLEKADKEVRATTTNYDLGYRP